MHPEVYQFIERVRPQAIDGMLIAEVGSLDVNGGVRGLFPRGDEDRPGCREYVGYDLIAGPGVDVVGDVSHYSGPRRYHLVISTEALEHAPDPAALFAAMGRMLAPRGTLLLTAAAPERPPHRADGTHGPLRPGEPYRNISPDELRQWCHAAGLTITALEHHPARGDVYLVAHASEVTP